MFSLVVSCVWCPCPCVCLCWIPLWLLLKCIEGLGNEVAREVVGFGLVGIYWLFGVCLLCSIRICPM